MNKAANAISLYGRNRLAWMRARIMATRDDSGAALIELAFGLTICTTLLLGAAEFGRLAYASIEVTDAAHTGAAYGALSHTSASDNSGMQLAATKDAPDVSGISATASHSCVCSNGSASTCSATDCSSSRIIESVTVTTTATFDPKIYVPGLPKSYTLNGKAVMRVLQ